MSQAQRFHQQSHRVRVAQLSRFRPAALRFQNFALSPNRFGAGELLLRGLRSLALAMARAMVRALPAKAARFPFDSSPQAWPVQPRVDSRLTPHPKLRTWVENAPVWQPHLHVPDGALAR